jgi:hypothetical protein
MKTTRKLAIAATAFGGVLAGATVDRGIVQMPAWHWLGPNAWADYSRHADLSARGFAFYPSVGIGHALLCVSTAVAASRDPRARVPACAAAILAIGGMATTVKAAPIMLSVRHLGDDPDALERARRGFTFSSAIRAVFQVGAFAANVWTLGAMTQ